MVVVTVIGGAVTIAVDVTAGKVTGGRVVVDTGSVTVAVDVTGGTSI